MDNSHLHIRLVGGEDWQQPAPASIEHGRGGPHDPGMDIGERIAKVEAAIEGLRHSQNLTVGAIGVLAAFVIGFGIYGLQRIDAVDGKIDQKLDALLARIDTRTDALSTRISEESARTRQDLIGITAAIANSITAARQMQAQPPPQPSPAPQP